jgi:CRP-like cAMP-binding protein
MLGLSENMSGERYRITAEAGEQTTAAIIPREQFLEFLREHVDFCMEVVRLLSADLHAFYHKFRGISALPRCARNRRLDEQSNEIRSQVLGFMKSKCAQTGDLELTPDTCLS